jgi:hypothetical protein
VKPFFGITPAQRATLEPQVRLRRQEGRLVAIEADPRYPPLDLPSGDARGGPEPEILGRVAGRWQEA